MENEDFENGEQEEYQEQESQERTETIPEGQDYKNIAEMDEEDLTDWARDDPKGYAANLAKQIRAELGAKRDLSAFARNEPSFIGLDKSGVLDDIIKAHPQLKGDKISAFYVHRFHDDRLKGEYTDKHGVSKALGDRLNERRGVRRSRTFGDSDCQPTMPEDM